MKSSAPTSNASSSISRDGDAPLMNRLGVSFDRGACGSCRHDRDVAASRRELDEERRIIRFANDARVQLLGLEKLDDLPVEARRRRVLDEAEILPAISGLAIGTGDRDERVFGVVL